MFPDTLIVIGCLKFQLTPKIFFGLLTKVCTSEDPMDTLVVIGSLEFQLTPKIFFGYIDSNRLSEISTDS
jgi:hypothetical protein